MLKKYTQTDRHGNMMSQEMDGKFLKKKILKDRHGNKMSFEFDIPESNVPPVSRIPKYSAKGGDTSNHPGDPKGTDTVPAWLTPGEFVVNKEATDIFGDVIEKMNNVGRKIQKQNGSAPDKMTDVTYANKGEAILALEDNPNWTAQLNSMLEKYKGPYFNKERLYEMMAGESSMTDTSEKYDKGSASGLFQITETPLKDMRRLGIVPKDFTTANIRAMDEVEQLKLYEKYLDMWGYQGNVHLGIMQAAPGAYTKAKNASEDGSVNPNMIAYEKDSRGYKQNKNWIDKETGNLTFDSIAKYSDSQSDNSDIRNALAQINKEIPGTVIEAADQVPPSNIMPVASNVPVSNTSGAQNIAGVPRIDLPSDTAFNAKSVPMDNFSANIPNYSGSTPAESDRELTFTPSQNMTNPRIGYESFDDLLRTKPMYALDMDADGRPDVSTMNMEEQLYGSPKIVMPPIQGTNVETKTLSERMGEAIPNIPRGRVDRRATEEDYQNFSGDIDAYIPQPPPVYQDAVMRAVKPTEQDTTLEVNEPGRSFKEVVNESFPGYNERLEKESVYPDKILSKALEQGKDINAPMFFPPTRDEKNPQGISTLPKTETETFRGTINEGKLEPPTVGGTKEVSIDEKKGKLAEVASNTKANEKLENTNKNTVEETGGKASQEEKNKAVGFLEGIFGSLFNKNELKRMAVMYLGSRLMGYDHGGSLNFAVKNYVARVDSLEASRIKFSQSAQAKNYTPESVAEYVRTGDYSKLIPLGKPIYRQGKFRNWYNKITGEKMVVEEVHEGTGDTKQVKFLGTDGKFHNRAEYDETGIYSKGSNDRLEIVNKFSKTFGGYIKELQVELEGTYGDQLDAVDGLTPGIAASEVINWMLNNKADITQIQTIIPMAYKAAIENEFNKPKEQRKKVNSLVPQLGELLYKQYTGQDQLFRTQPDKKHEKDWDGVAGKRDHVDMIKFTKALDEAAYITMSEFPEITDKNEAAALYIEDLAELWSGVRMEGSKLDDENLSKADRKDYWNYAYKTGTSGFYEFLKEKIDAEMKEALKKRNESN